MYKNIEKKVKLALKDQVEYQAGQVVSKTLVQNEAVSMTIFSFDKGEEISTHAAGGDAMVTVLEGKGRFTVAEEVFYLEAGETLIMPKDIPHAVYGEERFKMQLVVSYYWGRSLGQKKRPHERNVYGFNIYIPMFKYPAKVTQAKYGAISQAAFLSIALKARMHATISAHKNRSQKKENKNHFPQKKKIDHRKLTPN